MAYPAGELGVKTSKSAVDRFFARHGPILASGGFPQNVKLREAVMVHMRDGGAHYSMAPEGNTGDGPAAAEALGARRSEKDLNPAFWTPVSLPRRPDGREVPFPHLFLDRAKPGLIAVTGAGRRFVNESASYHDFVSGVLAPRAAGAERF